MIHLIEKYICLQYNIESSCLHERNGNNKLKRDREIVLARQLTVYYACLNGYYEREAGAFYGIDHATVNHAKNKIKDLCDIYHNFRERVEDYDRVLLNLKNRGIKAITDRMCADPEDKIKFVESLLSDVENDINNYISKLNDLKLVIFDLRKETSRTDVERNLEEE